MPIIVKLERLEELKKELLQDNPEDARQWTEYACGKCPNEVASDIAYESLHCIECGGTMYKQSEKIIKLNETENTR